MQLQFTWKLRKSLSFFHFFFFFCHLKCDSISLMKRKWCARCECRNNMVSTSYWLHHIFLEMDNEHRKWEMKVFVASYLAHYNRESIARRVLLLRFFSRVKRKYYRLQFIVFKIVLHCLHDLNVNALWVFISRLYEQQQINNLNKRVMKRLMNRNNKYTEKMFRLQTNHTFQLILFYFSMDSNGMSIPFTEL